MISLSGSERIPEATGEPFTAGSAGKGRYVEGDHWDADGPEFIDDFQVVIWVQERGAEEDEEDDED